ncbi:hypothetical protein [Streptomyces sp. NPDC059010]|uniref:hypothetical protein n=1 Tax=Streptomyces sp. NPDC059010 TaxID=3346695 RepID=UPI0036A7696D
MSDELSAALRELAAAQETPPVAGGAEIRGRAMRRRRRRRTAYALGAGTASLALLAFALTLDLGGNTDRQPGSRPPAVASPATTPTPAPTPTPTPTPTPASGTLDLRKHSLTLGDRTMPVLSEFASELDSRSPIKVVAKRRAEKLPFDIPPDGRTMVHLSYVVELRDGEGRPHFVGLYAPQLKALSDYDGKSSWLGLGEKDAAWFYDRVRVGDALSVTPEPAA